MSFTYKGKTAVFYLTAVFLLAVDRLLKLLAIKGFLLNLIGDNLKFNFTKNYFIAFSLPLGGFWLWLLIGLILVALVSYFIRLIKKPAIFEAGFVFLIILGAASNLLDRLKFGYVIDYFDLSYFTVFNLADAMICLGVVGLIVLAKKHN